MLSTWSCPNFCCMVKRGNPFPNNQILDETKLKAFADYKLNNKNDISIFQRVKNIVGKGENAWLPAFSPFPTIFSKGLFPRCL